MAEETSIAPDTSVRAVANIGAIDHEYDAGVDSEPADSEPAADGVASGGPDPSEPPSSGADPLDSLVAAEPGSSGPPTPGGSDSLGGSASSGESASLGESASSGDGDIPDGPPPLGAGVLFVLGLLWLAATMWSVRASIAGNTTDPNVIISSTALALPAIVVATLLAGAASALAATSRFARPAGSALRTVARRLVIGGAAGAGVGVMAAGVILFTFGANRAIGIIAATVGISALLGSITAALPAAPLAAGVAATIAVFISGALLNLFQSPLKSLLGAGETIASRTVAADRLLLVAALISGVVAGAMAYLYLRRRDPDRRWPWFLLAGAMPGLASLVGEMLTQLGGSSLFRIVGGFSESDRMVMDYLGGARIVSALMVTFVGGISAMILVGRTLRRPVETADPL